MGKLLRRLRRDDRGGMAVSVAVMPTVMMLFFTVIQTGLWFHGRSVITAAAQHGLEAARVGDGNPAAGNTTASHFLDQVEAVDQGYTVETHVEGDRMVITIDATPLGPLPFPDFPMSVTLSAPIERFVE